MEDHHHDIKEGECGVAIGHRQQVFDAEGETKQPAQVSPLCEALAHAEVGHSLTARDAHKRAEALREDDALLRIQCLHTPSEQFANAIVTPMISVAEEVQKTVPAKRSTQQLEHILYTRTEKPRGHTTK